MRRIEFRDIDAVFQEVDGAVQVTQHGRSYRARKWALTEGLEHTIRTAVRFGYTAFWVQGHPSDPYMQGGPQFLKGSHHITFARAAGEKWIFVADKPPSSYEVCFPKGLRDFFESIGLAHEWEHSGGHNVRIPLEKLEFALERLTPAYIDNLHRRSVAKSFVGRGSMVGLANEPQLHRQIVESFGGKLNAVGFSLESKVRTGPKSEPDLLLDARESGFFVLELKFSHVGLVEHDQLIKYLRSPDVVKRSAGRGLHGVLIGRDFSPELIEVANGSEGRVSLYAFSSDGKGIGFRLIAGQPTLRDAVPILFAYSPSESTGYVRAV